MNVEQLAIETNATYPIHKYTYEEREEGSPQLKFARSRTKVLSRCHRFEDGASGIDTGKGNIVTAPIDFDVLLLEREEDDQGANCDSAREGRGSDADVGKKDCQNLRSRSGGLEPVFHSLVILRPPAQETPPDVMIEDVGDGDCRPNVGHVVWSPDEPADQENRNVKVGKNLKLFAQEVKWNR